MTCLRKDKKHQAAAVRQRTMREITIKNIKVSEKGEEGHAPGTGANIPLQPCSLFHCSPCMTPVVKVSRLQPMKKHVMEQVDLP